MGWLEELINNAIAGQDREIEDAIEGIEWGEKRAKECRYKRDVAQARKKELVEALAKLYPPASPAVTEVLTTEHRDRKWRDPKGWLWQHTDRDIWECTKGGLCPMRYHEPVGKPWPYPFTEVLDGDK